MSYKKMLKEDLLIAYEELLDNYAALEEELKQADEFAVEQENALYRKNLEINDLLKDKKGKIAFLARREGFDRDDYEKIMKIINTVFSF